MSRGKAHTPNINQSLYNADNSFSDYIDRADAFMIDAKRDTVVKINEKLQKQIIYKDVPNQLILNEYTNVLNPWPAKHNRTGSDFLKYYPVESSL